MEITATILGLWLFIGQFVLMVNIAREDPQTNVKFAWVMLKYTGPCGLLLMAAFLVAMSPVIAYKKFKTQ